ncbi:adenylyltransferase and sulfurtransferase [Carboxydocella sporoproducens DSM 16521]|uniref:Adenylyltransferase and sulfurtransferase n=2 Tax=Carboxydocella TaxID=178898 RepID=A0A1T4NLL5_9FIRM|nr:MULTISPECIES: HesA/MoeB/ThiF family protein [Carboxydocella]AVX20101.1 adenylyltransferase and sulfurtransferase [Carboxydocella thermautotrophica]AVX30518.1 adenylyltransferase and sulfurtransferase [Carboxydocella thermautotrophica]SJZ80170.1 adenylyltransferase and sulfurtransferase [Carboxydocella sporoproducens DSM 16521]
MNSSRFERQLVMPEIGPEGQAKLKQGRVLVIGCGGLGSAVTYYLAAAGVGTLGLADNDRVEDSNLNRQILHGSHRLGWPKTTSAARTLQDFYPDLQVNLHQERITADNLLTLVREYQYDFVIDASDNFDTKFLINDLCVQAGIPFSHAGVLAWEGQTLTWVPGGQTPCLRCFFQAAPPPEITPTSKTVGILGAVAGTLGTIQAQEAIKFLLGAGQLLTGRLFIFDGLDMTARTLPFAVKPECICQRR